MQDNDITINEKKVHYSKNDTFLNILCDDLVLSHFKRDADSEMKIDRGYYTKLVNLLSEKHMVVWDEYHETEIIKSVFNNNYLITVDECGTAKIWSIDYY